MDFKFLLGLYSLMAGTGLIEGGSLPGPLSAVGKSSLSYTYNTHAAHVKPLLQSS